VRVVLDRDLAALYGVTTKWLNEQVKRNARIFPEDFMFQLSVEEKSEVVAKCDHPTTSNGNAGAHQWPAPRRVPLATGVLEPLREASLIK
jgi:hypothetical protein